MKISAIVFINLEKAYDRFPKEAGIARSFEEKRVSDSVCRNTRVYVRRNENEYEKYVRRNGGFYEIKS